MSSIEIIKILNTMPVEANLLLVAIGLGATQAYYAADGSLVVIV